MAIVINVRHSHFEITTIQLRSKQNNLKLFIVATRKASIRSIIHKISLLQNLT